MFIAEFPGCCTAKVLEDFYEEDSVNSSGVPLYGSARVQVNSLKEGIELAVEACRAEGNAVLIASTISSQKAANKALKDLGFTSSPLMKKTRHKKTKLRVWYLPLHK